MNTFHFYVTWYDLMKFWAPKLWTDSGCKLLNFVMRMISLNTSCSYFAYVLIHPVPYPETVRVFDYACCIVFYCSAALFHLCKAWLHPIKFESLQLPSGVPSTCKPYASDCPGPSILDENVSDSSMVRRISTQQVTKELALITPLCLEKKRRVLLAEHVLQPCGYLYNLYNLWG